MGMRSLEEGEIRVVGWSQTEKRRGEMNLTGTVGLAMESGLMGEEGEEELEKRVEGRIGGGSGGNLEERVELEVGDLMIGYDR